MNVSTCLENGILLSCHTYHGLYKQRGSSIRQNKKAHRPPKSRSSGMVHHKMERMHQRHVEYKEDFNIHKLVLYLNTLVH